MGVFRSRVNSSPSVSGSSRPQPQSAADDSTQNLPPADQDHDGNRKTDGTESAAQVVNVRTPSRSFYHRSFHNSIGTQMTMSAR